MDRSSFPPLDDDFTRALLRSAEGDEPSSAAYAKAAGALGVSVGVGVGLGVSASLPAPAAVAAGAGLAGAARWSGSAIAKAAAFGVSGALLLGGGAYLLHAGLGGGVGPSRGSASNPQAAVTAPPLRRAGLAASQAALGPEGAPVRAAAPVASLASNATQQAVVAPLAGGVPAPATPSSLSVVQHARRSARVSGQSQRDSSASSGSSLAEQVQSLDRARVSLGSGNAAGALGEIARYRNAWPHGVFLTEASVLEIEALAALGERSLAAARASSFVAAHPDSPQADRLRALIPAGKR